MKRFLKIICIALLVLVAGLIVLPSLIRANLVSRNGVATRLVIQSFEDLRIDAVEGDLNQAARVLKHLDTYSHSSLIQSKDHAYIIDMFRHSTIREIISRMRELSGEDLGDQPRPWIEKYYQEANTAANQALE